MSFPLPPKGNRTSQPPPEDPSTFPMDVPGANRLTDEESMFILKSYLRPEQYQDIKALKFIMAYLQYRNVSQASRDAGLSYKQGYDLRGKPEVHAAIEAITAKAVMKYGYDASEVIERVKEIAAIDPIEFENPDGSFKTHMSQISAESRRAIKKFKCKNIWGEDPNGMKIVIGQLIEVELWDKLKAVELLGREKNIFKETKKVEHDVTSNMASILLESKQRAETRLIEGAIDVSPKDGDNDVGDNG